MARIRFEDVAPEKPAGDDAGGKAGARRKASDAPDPRIGDADEETGVAAEIVEPADSVASGKKKRTKRAKPA